ncbi:rab-GTPase-TBC domain-containing protein [Daedaleopsis nitida]|nr:rab-GTPase-TBC domain-containing protein [Daedaleopsis nitida]
MGNDVHEKQWHHGVDNVVDDVDWQAYRLLSLQPHGFGAERVSIWPRLVHVDPRVYGEDHRREATAYSVWSDVSLDEALNEPDATSSGEPHQDERQIELDTDRSFVLYPVEGVSSREKLQTTLNRLIVSTFRRRPRLHYFQGYHDIVSVVFLTLPRELHIPVTEKLSLHRIRDSMGTNLDPVVGLLRILKRLLHLADPKFATILNSTAPLPYFALSNLLTLFSHDVPTLPLIQHIFDYLLCRPPIAVVYLAAALILTRRQEVQVLEEEGEEGMMHSLLTVLPDMYEEGEEPVKSEVEDPPGPPLTNEIKTEEGNPSAPVPGDTPFADVADIPSSIPPFSDQESVRTSTSDPQPASSADVSVVAPDPSPTDVLSPDAFIALADTQLPESVASNAVVEANPSESDLPDSAGDPAVKEEPTELPLPEADDEKPGRKLPCPEPEADEREPRPHRPRISVSALLRDADELFILYPPSHPGIALASVMGPQSVMLTWSERAADLPDDDEAERMVARPELIVLPHVEEPDDDDDAAGALPSEKEKRRGEKEERERRRRRLRKPRRLTDMVVQRKTMVAGAVLVLGVAMAVYGLNGGLPGTGNGSHRSGFGKEWRKVGRLLGGFVGAGGKVLDGLRRGLE